MLSISMFHQKMSRDRYSSFGSFKMEGFWCYFCSCFFVNFMFFLVFFVIFMFIFWCFFPCSKNTSVLFDVKWISILHCHGLPFKCRMMFIYDIFVHYFRKRNHKCFKLESVIRDGKSGRRRSHWEKVIFTLNFADFWDLKG